MDAVQVNHAVAPDVAVLSLVGELDAGTAPKCWSDLLDWSEDASPPRLVVVDLEKLTFLGAAGVQLLVSFARFNAQRNVPTRVVVPENGIVNRILTVVGVLPGITLHHSFADALAGGAHSG